VICNPFIDTDFVEVLAALVTETDVCDSRIQIVETYGAAGRHRLAASLESRLKEVGGVADEVFMYGKASIDVSHVEVGDLAANAGTCQQVTAVNE
jgi:hypothetical protein